MRSQLDPVKSRRSRHDGTAAPYQLKRSRFSSHSQILERLRHLPRPSRVLDVGGGEGFLSAPLTAWGHEVVCLAKPGSVVSDVPPHVRVIEADLDLQRPALSGPFDVVVCGDVLEHLRDPATTLEWLVHLLQPAGLVVGSFPNGVHLYVRLSVLSGRFPKHDRGLFDRTHLHFYSLRGWSDLLVGCGLDIRDVGVTPVPLSMLWPGRLGDILERAALAAAHVWKSLMAYQFVVVARRSPG